MMNIFEVNKRLKQRPPFQMIEKVLELVPGESARGTKNVCINEPYFAGHFPDVPIMPGVLVIESCAQLCSLVIEGDETDENVIYVLLKVDTFKLLKPILPGDTLDITVTKTSSGGTLTYFDAKVMVDGQIRAKGSMVFTAIPKESIMEG